MQPATIVRSPTSTRTLAGLSLAGVVLYVALDVLLFFLRPDLSILHRAESDYGNGPWAWVMDINFLVRCALSLAAVGALWNILPRTATTRAALALLTLWAVASGVLAFFPDDYPGAPPTRHGAIHLLAAGIAFLSCLIATILLTAVIARVAAGRPVVAVLVACCVLALLGVALLLLAGFKPHGLGGLYERVFLGAELLWLAAAMAALPQFAVGPRPARAR